MKKLILFLALCGTGSFVMSMDIDLPSMNDGNDDQPQEHTENGPGDKLDDQEQSLLNEPTSEHRTRRQVHFGDEEPVGTANPNADQNSAQSGGDTFGTGSGAPTNAEATAVANVSAERGLRVTRIDNPSDPFFNNLPDDDRNLVRRVVERSTRDDALSQELFNQESPPNAERTEYILKKYERRDKIEKARQAKAEAEAARLNDAGRTGQELLNSARTRMDAAEAFRKGGDTLTTVHEFHQDQKTAMDEEEGGRLQINREAREHEERERQQARSDKLSNMNVPDDVRAQLQEDINQNSQIDTFRHIFDEGDEGEFDSNMSREDRLQRYRDNENEEDVSLAELKKQKSTSEQVNEDDGDLIEDVSSLERTIKTIANGGLATPSLSDLVISVEEPENAQVAISGNENLSTADFLEGSIKQLSDVKKTLEDLRDQLKNIEVRSRLGKMPEDEKERLSEKINKLVSSGFRYIDGSPFARVHEGVTTDVTTLDQLIFKVDEVIKTGRTHETFLNRDELVSRLKEYGNQEIEVIDNLLGASGKGIVSEGSLHDLLGLSKENAGKISRRVEGLKQQVSLLENTVASLKRVEEAPDLTDEERTVIQEERERYQSKINQADQLVIRAIYDEGVASDDQSKTYQIKKEQRRKEKLENLSTEIEQFRNYKRGTRTQREYNRLLGDATKVFGKVGDEIDALSEREKELGVQYKEVKKRGWFGRTKITLEPDFTDGNKDAFNKIQEQKKQLEKLKNQLHEATKRLSETDPNNSRAIRKWRMKSRWGYLGKEPAPEQHSLDDWNRLSRSGRENLSPEKLKQYRDGIAKSPDPKEQPKRKWWSRSRRSQYKVDDFAEISQLHSKGQERYSPQERPEGSPAA